MSKPIEGCPQPEAEIRERAYTPEQLERHAKHCDAVEEHDAARMLRTFAATLRQPTNPHGIGSKLVQAEQAGGVVSDAACNVPPSGWSCSRAKGHDGPCAALPVGKIPTEIVQLFCRAFLSDCGKPGSLESSAMIGLEAVAPLLRAPATPESKVYRCPRCATSMQVDPSAKPRAPGEQCQVVITTSDPDGHHCVAVTRQDAEGRILEVLWEAPAALAQNAQGEAVVEVYRMGNGLGSLVYTDYGAKSDLPHGTKLYTHAERARVPATDADIAAWAERHDLSFGGSKIDARSAFEDAETLHLAADPSLRAEDHRDLQLGEMKRRACIAHTLCYELSLRHPEIPELGDDGKLHCAIHDVLAVDTPSAKVSGPLPGGAAAPSQPEEAA